MKDLPNIYEWTKPYDILDVFDTNIYKDKYGVKYVTSVSEQMLLFKVDGRRYILPNKKDEVQYRGNGSWNIRRNYSNES
ncbi:hypothetical protein [uncultured Lactobacillus sp.]|uniref:hypothetical protein n=1 Tax=uncultured Lactobacillus sp. TaxID=153152 RepID=UPI00262754AC|nr:hypothetical protein [uncultured Lactobacillus sp.]